MPIDVTIKARDGKAVKSFALRGPDAMRKVALWIWREIFMSMLAHGTPFVIRSIPEMIAEIEALLGWRALERLLSGGNPSVLDEYEGGDDGLYEEDEDLDDNNAIDYVEEDGDEDFVDEDAYHGSGMCPFHGGHWPASMEGHRLQLQKLVENHLHTAFRAMPSMDLFKVIRAISVDPRTADHVLLEETDENATKSSDTLNAALEIYTSKRNAFRLHAVLSSHSHLLRPQDTETLQHAVRILANGGYALFGLHIFERELFEAARAIYASLIAVFGNIELAEYKVCVEEILKLRPGSLERKNSIERWIDLVVTQQASMNPMTFTMMMMGLQMGGPPEGGPDDPAGFLDNVDQNDSDWDDAMEEFRPPLKERFDGWIELSLLWKEISTNAVLSGVYAKAVQLMPFLCGADIVEQMIVRLTNLQGRTHVARALQSLSNFCIFHRKKLTTAANKQRRAADKATDKATKKAAPTPFGTTNPPFSFSFQPQPQSQPQLQPQTRYGGMEDVD
ncbi:hypothetical protein DXG01_012622 [Tephrocybe rancida]|nr:hypothetical protein DXG01_012622 [Tephrocybe rancida]